MTKKALFFCDRPLQAYNATSVAAMMSRDGWRSDILLCNRFRDVEQYASALNNSAFFGRVILYEPEYDVGTPGFRRHELKVFFGLASDETLINALGRTGYDVFLFACPNYETFEIAMSLRGRNPDLQVALFEEGTGSYTGEVFRRLSYLGTQPDGIEHPSAHARLLRWLMMRKLHTEDFYSPSFLYLKRPDLLQYLPKCPAIRFSVPKQVAERFGAATGACLQSLSSVVVFGPSCEFDYSNRYEEFLAKFSLAMTSRKIEWSFRRHPTSNGRGGILCKGATCSDCSNGLWETYCHNVDFSGSVLMGIGSTAQLSPIIEAGQRPILVFLHKICCEATSRAYRSAEAVRRLALSLYGDKQSIYAPSSIDEAISIVTSVRTAGCDAQVLH